MFLVHLQKVRKIIILPKLLGLKPNRVIIRLVLIKNILARKVSHILGFSLYSLKISINSSILNIRSRFEFSKIKGICKTVQKPQPISNVLHRDHKKGKKTVFGPHFASNLN